MCVPYSVIGYLLESSFPAGDYISRNPMRLGRRMWSVPTQWMEAIRVISRCKYLLSIFSFLVCCLNLKGHWGSGEVETWNDRKLNSWMSRESPSLIRKTSIRSLWEQQINVSYVEPLMFGRLFVTSVNINSSNIRSSPWVKKKMSQARSSV